jgi:C-terminal processing protease CtpA/Prc
MIIAAKRIVHAARAVAFLLASFLVFAPAAGAWADQPLQAETVQSDPDSSDDQQVIIPNTTHLYGTVRKLENHEQLSADEFRSLGIGVIGLDAVQQCDERYETVTRIYTDSPADRAGIRVGDKLVARSSRDVTASWRAHPLQKEYVVRFDKEGIGRDIVLLRHGERIRVRLVPMNIEDIEEPDLRQFWEQTAYQLGEPQSGIFFGQSLNDLTRSRQD